MKKTMSFVIVFIMLASFVVASKTTLVPDAIQMEHVDVEVVTFCINGTGNVPLDAIVVVNPICKNINGLYGCQPADLPVAPSDFNVVPLDATTGADGCVDLEITTNLESGEEGTFYYTVNGFVGEVDTTPEGSETGVVFVPEFGVVAAGLALAGAGVYIARKRKQ